jgi:hypothetical protein
MDVIGEAFDKRACEEKQNDHVEEVRVTAYGVQVIYDSFQLVPVREMDGGRYTYFTASEDLIDNGYDRHDTHAL